LYLKWVQAPFLNDSRTLNHLEIGGYPCN